MSTQTVHQKKENQKNEIFRILAQKQELVKQLVDRCNRQQKQLTNLLAEQKNKKTVQIQFNVYKDYIFSQEVNNERLTFLYFKIKSKLVTNQQPIIISNSLQLQIPSNQLKNTLLKANKANKQIAIPSQNQEQQFQTVLSKNVEDLRQNLQKCETLITNLKELKEIDKMQGERQVELRSQSLRIYNKKSKMATQQQQSQIRVLQKNMTKCLKENQQLRKKVQSLEQAQKYYLSVIEDLQIQRIKYQQGSPAKQLKEIRKQVTPNKQKKRQGRVYLVNY